MSSATPRINSIYACQAVCASMMKCSSPSKTLHFCKIIEGKIRCIPRLTGVAEPQIFITSGGEIRRHTLSKES
jgi:hypothetical protein